MSADDRPLRDLRDDELPSSGPVAYMARNGVAANLLLAFLLFAGLFSYSSIVQEVLPENSLETVQVSVSYPGATPEEVEESIVQKIEEAVQSVEGVKEIRATAQESVGTVTIELQLGTDVSRALDDIKSEIDQIQTFPQAAEEPDVREITTRQSVIHIAIYGDVGERVLKELAYRLEDSLGALPDVSYAQTNSIRDYEISIEVPEAALRTYGLSLNDIARIVAASSLDAPAGAIETSDEEIRVRTLGQNYTQQQFEQIVLASSPSGATVRLGQVAQVRDAFEDTDLISLYNGEPVAFVEVYRTSDERVLDVAGAVHAYLEEDFGPSLPEGVQYAVWQDDSVLLEDRLGLMLKNGAIGLVLVLIVLTLFLEARLAFWTAVGLLVSFVGAISLLQMAGSTINMFSLFGFILVLGLVVDDAIVVGENIYAERERGRGGLAAAVCGARRVTVPVIFAVLTTVAAFSPLLTVEGFMGKLLRDIPLVVIAVLGLSLIESLLILPNHLSKLPRPDERPKSPILRRIATVQRAVDQRLKRFTNGPLERALRYSVSMPLIVVASALALVVLSLSLIPAGIIKVQAFPEIEGDIVSASLEMPAGTPVEVTENVARRIQEGGRKALAELEAGRTEDAPDLMEGVYTIIGGQVSGVTPAGPRRTMASNLASIQFKLLSADEREISAVAFENAWRDAVGPVPAARSLTFSSSLLSSGDPVAVQLSHPDPVVLDVASRRLMNQLERFNGVFDIQNDRDEGLREIILRLKPAARTLGVTLEDVAGQVRAAFFGAEALRVQRGREDVRVYVRLPEDQRDSIADVRRFRVRVPGGEVALSELAEVSFDTAPSVIRREASHRITTVTANVNTDVVTGQEIGAQLQDGILPALAEDYPDLAFSFAGEQEEQAESFADLGMAFLAAMLMIYALLAIPFRSYVQPLIILSAVPFGIIGALLGHIVMGIPLGVLSFFGIIGLSGVVVNDALVMIDFINEQRRQGVEPADAIVAGAKGRFRPILLTSATTFLGVAPITFETSLQGQFLIPMAASLAFGILVATAILMLLVPALAMLQMKAVARLQAGRAGELRS